MGWFSGLGHELSHAVKGIDHAAAKINPMQGIMEGLANKAGDVWKPLGKAGHWGDNHPAEAAAIAAAEIYSAGSATALLPAFGDGLGSGGAAGSTAYTSAIKQLAGQIPKGGSTGGSNVATDSSGSGNGSGVDWSSVIGGLGSLYSGMSANHQASGLQSILNNSYSFNASRPMYAAELNQLMADPEKAVTSSPGYKAEMDQALTASQRTAASQGLTGSGTEAAALAFTGAQTEQSAYDKLFSQLSMLSGATLDPAKMFGEQMSVDQTKQGGSGGVFSGLSSMGSMFGGGSGGSSGGSSGLGSLGSWFSGLFNSSPEADSGSINLFADAAGG